MPWQESQVRELLPGGSSEEAWPEEGEDQVWAGLGHREKAWPGLVLNMAPSRFRAWASTRSSRQQPGSPTESLHPTDRQSLNLEHLSKLNAPPTPTFTAFPPP